MDVISNKNATKEQKKASKVILVIKYGKIKANNLIEDIAIVINRNDSLVRRWRKKVIERDKKCVKCGSVKHLNAHHISHWSYDPIHRVNVNYGVTLCKNCHALEHLEIDKLIKSGGST
ncbi:HNH endonuclease, partial [Staphylococcus haemolyticus]|uniref:HNH endonuclease n=1 Tax=Staphylococcus haemolyticus TaxID=1283 RepID=UPI0015D89B49